MRRLLNSTIQQRCGTKPANTEMIEGFRDGYDLNSPEPSANRSASYRHGFMCARIDKGKVDSPGFASLERMADAAMAEDDVRAIQ